MKRTATQAIADELAKVRALGDRTGKRLSAANARRHAAGVVADRLADDLSAIAEREEALVMALGLLTTSKEEGS